MLQILLHALGDYGNKYLLLLLSTVQGCWDAWGNLCRRAPDSMVVCLIPAQARRAARKVQAAVIKERMMQSACKNRPKV